MSAKFVEIFQQNTKYRASVDHGPRFDVGRVVHYEGNVGVTNDGAGSGALYDWTAFPGEGHWAPMIFPTAICESSAFMTNVNTYDSAKFTFGFFQFAAHVENGDFVRFFRRILATPSGADYWPDLSVQNGRIFRLTQNGAVQLEDDHSSRRLMDYLNPSSSSVENIEVINAAKFIDGATNDASHRQIQVDEAINTAKGIMKFAGQSYGLNGLLDKICLVILDIRHQGRAKSQSIMQALNSSSTDEGKFNNLLALGSSQFNERKATLRREIKKLVDAGVLGSKHYVKASNDFA